jgi:hypothetical protein
MVAFFLEDSVLGIPELREQCGYDVRMCSHKSAIEISTGTSLLLISFSLFQVVPHTSRPGVSYKFRNMYCLCLNVFFARCPYS